MPADGVVGGRRMGIKGNPIIKEAAVGCSDAVCGIIVAVEPVPEVCACALAYVIVRVKNRHK